jgi:beta-galactosidase GanA
MRGMRSILLGAVAMGAVAGAMSARAQDLPKIVEQDGRAALMVDGSPFFLLGAQVDNSSGWVDRLNADWPVAEKMRLNTLEVPVYWEQMEPVEGRFDFSVADALVGQARTHRMRLVLLWFGTWKNGRMHYAPDWVKTNRKRFPRVMTRDGKALDVLSSSGTETRAADAKAFAALMAHLKTMDPQHTVIMMQVENESGTLGSVRDFGAVAQKEFDGAVPETLLKALHKQPGTWAKVFGDDADETFAAWGVASYIGAVAAAGKKELALPMYANNWLKSPRGYPVDTVPGEDYPSGGPTWNMHAVWKAAAPALDLLAPDIYVPNSADYIEVMRQFHTAANPLLIPESLGFEPFPGASGYSRNLYYAIGEGAIGFAQFGIDRVVLGPDGKAEDRETASQIEGSRLIGSFDRELAALMFAGKVRTAVEEPGRSQETLRFDAGGSRAWRAMVSFPPAYDPPAAPLNTASDTMALHAGRAVVAQLGATEFLVTGIDCRVAFAPPIGMKGVSGVMFGRVEQGHYAGTTWVVERLWNGDETDYGLNFGGKGTLLHVTVEGY